MNDASRLVARLRDRITLQHVALSSDGLGGNTESWTDVVTLFAEVRPLLSSAREQVIAAQREARNAYAITLRQRDGITTAMRIQWDGRTLHIQGVMHKRATTHITAYEGGEA